jgi:hypothetical protein
MSNLSFKVMLTAVFYKKNKTYRQNERMQKYKNIKIQKYERSGKHQMYSIKHLI